MILLCFVVILKTVESWNEREQQITREWIKENVWNMAVFGVVFWRRALTCGYFFLLMLLDKNPIARST